jgi:1-deoxy-D-xylulose-5-phosphate reductoisomerase
MVQFSDSSIKAQMGMPDMRLPIQYALTHPDRLESNFPRFEFSKYPMLNFEAPDIETFRNLGFAFVALEKAGNMPCILNAANEVAVEGFLKGKIGFLAMSDLLEYCMEKVAFVEHPAYDNYVETDNETRIIAKEYLDKWKD